METGYLIGSCNGMFLEVFFFRSNFTRVVYLFCFANYQDFCGTDSSNNKKMMHNPDTPFGDITALNNKYILIKRFIFLLLLKNKYKKEVYRDQIDRHWYSRLKSFVIKYVIMMIIMCIADVFLIYLTASRKIKCLHAYK